MDAEEGTYDLQNEVKENAGTKFFENANKITKNDYKELTMRRINKTLCI